MSIQVGGSILLTKKLAAGIGLAPNGPRIDTDEGSLTPTSSPAALLGGHALDVAGIRTFIVDSATRISARDDAEGGLPASFLCRYDVVFDYPRRLFTLARPRSLPPLGRALPVGIDPHSHFIRTRVAVDGHSYGLMLDTGGTYTMISNSVLRIWSIEHPQWPHTVGAVGPANMVGGRFEADLPMLDIPHVQWGRFQAQNAGAVGRPTGTYERWMSSQMSSPIVGSLSGNVLGNFRVQIDYATNTAYLQQTNNSSCADSMIRVGLTLTYRAFDGALIVSGVSAENAPPVVNSIHIHDQLVRIDGHNVTGSSLSDAARMLAGKAGTTHLLVLSRNGKLIHVAAPVVRILR